MNFFHPSGSAPCGLWLCECLCVECHVIRLLTVIHLLNVIRLPGTGRRYIHRVACRSESRCALRLTNVRQQTLHAQARWLRAPSNSGASRQPALLGTTCMQQHIAASLHATLFRRLLLPVLPVLLIRGFPVLLDPLVLLVLVRARRRQLQPDLEERDLHVLFG